MSVVDILWLSIEAYESWLLEASQLQKNWIEVNHFRPAHGKYLTFFTSEGQLDAVIAIYDENKGPRVAGKLVRALPPARYRFTGQLSQQMLHGLSLYWQLACYAFSRYKDKEPVESSLELDKGIDQNLLAAQVEAVYLVRDLVNTPAEDMNPSELSQCALGLARQYGGHSKHFVGEELLENNFPLVHTVGRASENQPELTICQWGNEGPLITVVGKGVTFDSGGLNIKPSRAMYPMKKDMGGAAHAIALCSMILKLKLPCQLKLVIPAVENAISGRSYRPGDIYASRNGKTVEIGDTDAEGRLILADALSYACEEKPDFLVDFATLTGSARVAMGPDVPCYFTNNPQLLSFNHKGELHDDMIWPLPLIEAYRSFIDSNIADLHSTGSEVYGGAITTALFLESFVNVDTWMHLDLNAFSNRSRDGQPIGGEAQGLLCVYDTVSSWLESLK